MFLRTVIFIVLSQAAIAQVGLSKAELLQMLAKPQPDSTLIDIYNELCWPVYSYDDTDSSLYFGTKAMDLAGRLNDIKRLSIAHRRIGITHINAGNSQKAIQHEEESYRLSEQIGFKKGMQLALNNIGVTYLNNEIFNKALTYFLRSLKIVEQTGDHKSAPSLYSNCGMIYRRMQDLHQSKKYFLKAIDFTAPDANPDLQLINNANLCTAYRLLGKIELLKVLP